MMYLPARVPTLGGGGHGASGEGGGARQVYVWEKILD